MSVEKHVLEGSSVEESASMPMTMTAVSNSNAGEGDFETRGAFLLTPATEQQAEKIAGICDKMPLKGSFSLTKTATGLLFQFSDVEDYQITFKKTFYKVTNCRFYKKIPIFCRPRKMFSIYVLDVPEDIPEEDIKYALYVNFPSVADVRRIRSSSPISRVGKYQTDTCACPLLRATLSNLEECNILLRDGLDFYGATYFPTEAATPTAAAAATPFKRSPRYWYA